MKVCTGLSHENVWNCFLFTVIEPMIRVMRQTGVHENDVTMYEGRVNK